MLPNYGFEPVEALGSIDPNQLEQLTTLLQTNQETNQVAIQNALAAFQAALISSMESIAEQAVETASTSMESTRLLSLENLIIPFLVRLQNSPEKEYIHWPNRQDSINTLISSITALTRNA
jgi:hypothetical protein